MKQTAPFLDVQLILDVAAGVKRLELLRYATGAGLRRFVLNIIATLGVSENKYFRYNPKPNAMQFQWEQ